MQEGEWNLILNLNSHEIIIPLSKTKAYFHENIIWFDEQWKKCLIQVPFSCHIKRQKNVVII